MRLAPTSLVLLALCTETSAALGQTPPPAPPGVEVGARTTLEVLPRPELPAGAVVPRTPRPATGRVACALDGSVCVHAAPGVSDVPLAWSLHHAEGALAALRALGLPRPRRDGGRGGSDALDLYLAFGEGPATLGLDRDGDVGAFDRATAFVRVPVAPAPAGVDCAPAATLVAAVVEAALVGLDAALEPGIRRGAGAWFASLTTPCPALELAAMDAVQRAPERPLTAAPPGGGPDVLLPWFLEDAYGAGTPGGVVFGLAAIATQTTPGPALTWRNEPDLFDALRSSLAARDAKVGDVLLDLAVARAFVGTRSDDRHLRDAARFGTFGRVRFEWSVPAASRPRRLAPLRPIDATGMTYVWIDLAGAPAPERIVLRWQWELPVLFRWAVVKVDPSGAETGRIDVAGVPGTTEAQQTVLGLDGLAGLLVVGVNLGDVDAAFPFDPDDEPFEPHGYLVTIE